MNLTLKQYKRLPLDERNYLIRKHATMFAYETYKKRNPGCDLDCAFAVAERTWATFKGMALDYLACAMALNEQQIEAN